MGPTIFQRISAVFVLAAYVARWRFFFNSRIRFGSGSWSCACMFWVMSLYAFLSAGIKLYFAANFSANMLALAVGSKTQHPSSEFRRGIFRVFGFASSSCLVLVHQALLEGSSSLSWPVHFRVYSRNPARIPALHVSAASRAPDVPSASVFGLTSSSV